jgi:hypothetical protein
MSSDSIVKGIIDDIIKTAVKTAEADQQKTKRKHEKVIGQLYKVNTEQNINNILLINMTQSCQIKHFICILRLLNNTCVKHNFKSVHVKVILVGTGVQLKFRKHPNAYIAIK